MKKTISKSHEFAIYYEILSDNLGHGDTFTVVNQDLMHRITRVLRIKKGEPLLFFNREWHALLRIVQVDRKSMRLELISAVKNKRYTPTISFLLPILKRDALAQAVYYLVETGVNELQLVQTENMQRKWGGEKERERLERICIAAAEQSKNFAFPLIKDPLSLADALQAVPPDALCFYGNPEGNHFREIRSDIMPGHFVLTCGPEADFSSAEKVQLQEESFQALRLTPTILRAETAVLCLSSLFRTVFS